MDVSADEVMDKIVNLSKRRGFVFQSAEIYGGTRSSYDYGPIGALMLRIYPSADLLIESGPAFLAEQETIDFDSPELRLNMEYQPPKLRRWGLSLFVEDRIEEPFLVGVRAYLGDTHSLIRRHRMDGLMRLRF